MCLGVASLHYTFIPFLFQEFSPGSNGRKTTMGLYVRDLLLGQVSCPIFLLIPGCVHLFKFVCLVLV